MTIRIGITGGIGSGKSVVARLMRIMNIPIYDADTRSKRLLDTSPPIRKALIKLMGPSIYSGDTIDRRLMASLIFADSGLLARTNAVIHPEVGRDFETWASRCDWPVCAIESAILFESGLNRIVDVSLMISAPVDLRIARAMNRDRSDRSAIEQRIARQMPDDEKALLANYVIINDGVRALIPQVEFFLKEAMEM
jgi:dephospho-CoA kinase